MTSVSSMRAIPQTLSVITIRRDRVQALVGERAQSFSVTSHANDTSAVLGSPLYTATGQDWKLVVLFLFSDSLTPCTNEPHKVWIDMHDTA